MGYANITSRVVEVNIDIPFEECRQSFAPLILKYQLFIIALCLTIFIICLAMHKKKVKYKGNIAVIEEDSQNRLKEEKTMDEFYKQTINLIRDLEKDFEERVKEAEKVGSFDVAGRSAIVADVISKINIKYLEAKERLQSKRKGGWFK